MHKLFNSGILAVLLIALNCGMAGAATPAEMSTAMLRELVRHQTVDFNDSALSGHYPRASIAGGLGEKILNRFYEENGDTLGFMLTESAQPSGVSGNPYVDATMNQVNGGKSYQQLLAERITASSGNLMPDQVLGMALDVTGGDYWLATLTAHNLLKEVAYASRNKRQAMIGWEAGKPDNADSWAMLNTNDILDKLSQLRPSGDKYSSDKIGPWYHMYGLFFVGGMLSGTEAEFMAGMENLTRSLGLGSSNDPFKEQMNSWAASLTHSMNELVANGVYAPADLSGLSKDELQVIFDRLRAQHKAYQEQLNALNNIVQGGGPGWADQRMTVIREIQQALYQEALRVREEMNSR